MHFSRYDNNDSRITQVRLNLGQPYSTNIEADNVCDDPQCLVDFGQLSGVSTLGERHAATALAHSCSGADAVNCNGIKACESLPNIDWRPATPPTDYSSLPCTPNDHSNEKYTCVTSNAMLLSLWHKQVFKPLLFCQASVEFSQ